MRNINLNSLNTIYMYMYPVVSIAHVYSGSNKETARGMEVLKQEYRIAGKF